MNAKFGPAFQLPDQQAGGAFLSKLMRFIEKGDRPNYVSVLAPSLVLSACYLSRGQVPVQPLTSFDDCEGIWWHPDRALHGWEKVSGYLGFRLYQGPNPPTTVVILDRKLLDECWSSEAPLPIERVSIPPHLIMFVNNFDGLIMRGPEFQAPVELFGLTMGEKQPFGPCVEMHMISATAAGSDDRTGGEVNTGVVMFPFFPPGVESPKYRREILAANPDLRKLLIGNLSAWMEEYGGSTFIPHTESLGPYSLLLNVALNELQVFHNTPRKLMKRAHLKTGLGVPWLNSEVYSILESKRESWLCVLDEGWDEGWV